MKERYMIDMKEKSGGINSRFKTGLELIKADFHLHTRKDKEFSYAGMENNYVTSYVEALKRENIGVGVLTNHNKFDEDEYKAIKKRARKEGIFILPGVELTVKEGANGVHTLIVFNPDEWLANGNNHIQTFLTGAFATIPNYENRNTKCTYDLKDVLEKLDAYGRDYFVIFAHVDQKSGLFEECSGGLLESLSGIVPFKKRVLGLQKAHSRNNLLQFEQWFGYIPALVEGSDPKSISEIGKGTREVFLKIGEFSYSAIKFALQDYKNRVFTTPIEIKHGYIESISFQGGKFDGQTIRFSPELNTLIGVRGSGKSSVLEVVRYLFDLPIQADKEYKSSLIKNIFGSGGKAVLSVVDKHGKKYSISRIQGERVNIQNELENDLNISALSLFDGIQYFGQKDLSSSSEQENCLLEKLVGGKIGEKADVDSCAIELITAVSQLLDAGKIPAQIGETTMKKADVEHKMSVFKEKGVDAKLKKQTGYIKDREKLIAIQTKIFSVLSSLRNAYKFAPMLVEELQGIESEYNKEVFDEITKVLTSIDHQLQQIGNTIQQIQSQSDAFEAIMKNLTKRIDNLADEFAEIKREINDESLDVDSFVTMTADLERYKNQLKELEEKAASRTQIEVAFNKAARERNDILLALFKAYESEVDRINANQDELEIRIDFKGDRENFKKQLKTDFRGTGISDAKYQEISEKFIDYVALIEDWIIHDGKKVRTIISPSEYVKLSDKLQEQYPDLIKKQVMNKVEIYYHGKLLRQHSIGQKASALILFILTQSDNDIIIIDQPEDDLDNKIIYDELISTIIKKKQSVQFIFATHNANIPVLGDAERVLVVEYQDKKIEVNQGNIDSGETHQQIVDIMEGGKEAFDKRQIIYTSWR